MEAFKEANRRFSTQWKGKKPLGFRVEFKVKFQVKKMEKKND